MFCVCAPEVIFQRAVRRIEPHLHLHLAKRLEGVWTWGANLPWTNFLGRLCARVCSTHYIPHPLPHTHLFQTEYVRFREMHF